MLNGVWENDVTQPSSNSAEPNLNTLQFSLMLRCRFSSNPDDLLAWMSIERVASMPTRAGKAGSISH